MVNDDSGDNRKPPAAILAAFLNYGTLMNDEGFNDLVCDLEERGVCVIPPAYWVN